MLFIELVQFCLYGSRVLGIVGSFSFNVLVFFKFVCVTFVSILQVKGSFKVSIELGLDKDFFLQLEEL